MAEAAGGCKGGPGTGVAGLVVVISPQAGALGGSLVLAAAARFIRGVVEREDSKALRRITRISRRLNCTMLLIVPSGKIPEPRTISIHKRSRSRPPSLSSPNSTPEDIWSRSRIGVLPYSLPLKPPDIGFHRVVDRSDCTLGNCDADQHGDDRLGPLSRIELVAIGSPILIMLEEGFVIFGDQQAGDRGAVCGSIPLGMGT